MMPIFFSGNFLPETTIAIVEIEKDEMLSKGFLQSKFARIAATIAAEKEIEIENNEHGKPYDKNNEFQVSLSHSKWWGAAAVSKKNLLGIDVETIEPRIERIAHKFLQPYELEQIKSERIKTLSLYWSAKESLYKLYAQKQLDFAQQLIIEPFDLHPEGMLKAKVLTKETKHMPLEVAYKFFENHVLTGVCAQPNFFNR